jgi:peroxiredoxin Q/BCP
MAKPRKKTRTKKKSWTKKATAKKKMKLPKKRTRPARNAVLASPPAPEGTLREGDPAPDFRIPNDAGRETGISDFRGRKVVLYFYPEDDESGCTWEASSFRDGLAAITNRGATVVGVSCDPVDSHRAFKEKYGLNFHLLSDSHRDVVRKYGVWREQSVAGRTFMGIERTTFLVDEEGKIAKIFPKVDVRNHYGEVLKALRN